jgi:hypothetical protein
MVTRMRFLADGALWYLQGSQMKRVGFAGAVAAESRAAAPRLAVFPNPAAGPVVLEFALPGTLACRGLAILDVAGRTVRRFTSGELPRGTEAGAPARLLWDGRADGGRDAGSGVFFAVLDHDGGRTARRIVRLRP